MSPHRTITAELGSRQEALDVVDVTCRPVKPTRKHRWWERGFLRTWSFVSTIGRRPTGVPTTP